MLETSPPQNPLSLQLQQSLRGSVHRIVYNNEENGYTVLALQAEGHNDPVTVVGKFAAIQLGEEVLCHGHWTDHNRYGKQFQVAHYERNLPETIKGIRSYLGSMVKGIGPKKAELLVNYFGIDTLRVIQYESQRLTEVPGIGPVSAERIRAGWEEASLLKEVMVYFQGYGVSQHHAYMIHRTYGNQAIQTVRENPYRLATDVRGIGFLTADQIAQSLGIPADSAFRARAAILFQLKSYSDQGHVYVPRSELLQSIEQNFKIPHDALEQAIAYLDANDEISLEPLEDNDTAVYLVVLAACERGSVHRLREVLDIPPPSSHIRVDAVLTQFQKDNHITLATAQIDAIKMALAHSVSIITGGPGTGKTTIIRAVCELARRQDRAVLLTAPTGRAAKRLSETTGQSARTLHRTLEFSPQEFSFQRNRDNPLEGDIVIVDEVSMLDIYLFYALIRAVQPGSQLLLVGDVDQLPSVGPGNVLRDLLQCGEIPVTRLNQIFRQKENGLIVENAHLINQGQLPILPKASADQLLDFYFIQRDDPLQGAQTIRELVTQRIPQRFHIDPLKDIQVISPMYKGDVGVKNLNTLLQEHFCKHQKKHIDFSGNRFYPGDRILQTRNDYNKEVFNGDVGFIVDIDTENAQITAMFEEREITYERHELDALTLAYAVSVHKSQGSEYAAVVIPVFTQHYVMLQRNLLYTALTRGKRLVILVGDERALQLAVRNDQIRKRYCRLGWRLEQRTPPPPLPWRDDDFALSAL
ncbi:ATP-dependent RecD-like DNA helicase [Myxococcota bacterium]|nr:ATP-dependent RecD-like DNA helicase [Myxococcota bacterium]